MKKEIIIAQNKEHLLRLIKQEIDEKGNECDLNHIDVSNIKSMEFLFSTSKFNGNISQWNVSNVEHMGHMFHGAEFTGDISRWNVSKVVKMNSMFNSSKFNGDISRWNIEKVKDMYGTFLNSNFEGDLSFWKPLSLIFMVKTFEQAPMNIPYWGKYENKEERINAITAFNNKLNLEDMLVLQHSEDKHSKKIKV